MWVPGLLGAGNGTGGDPQRPGPNLPSVSHYLVILPSPCPIINRKVNKSFSTVFAYFPFAINMQYDLPHRTKVQSKFRSLSVGNTVRILKSCFRTGIIPVKSQQRHCLSQQPLQGLGAEKLWSSQNFLQDPPKEGALETQAPRVVICSVFLPIYIYIEVVSTNTIPLPSAPLFFQPVQPLNLQVRLKPRGTYACYTWNPGPSTSHAHIFLQYNHSGELQ